MFGNLASSATNDELQAVELEMAPRLSAHWSAISMHPVLFARLDAVYQARAGLGLDNESLKVLERYHLDFVRAGARFEGAKPAAGWRRSASASPCWARSSARMCWATRKTGRWN